MRPSQIRFISFDCYGTLTNFHVGELTRQRLADLVEPDSMPRFLEDFTAYRFDEVLGDWKPYADVLHQALERSCRRWNITFRPEDAAAIVEAVPTWGPHADVPEPLARVAKENNRIRLCLAAFKPRLRAFEYMFDTLGCGPEHMMHVSSSLRYDLMSASDLRIGHRVFVDRGHGPGNPAYGYQAIPDIGGLPGLLGIA